MDGLGCESFHSDMKRASANEGKQHNNSLSLQAINHYKIGISAPPRK